MDDEPAVEPSAEPADEPDEFAAEKRHALAMLRGIERGTMTPEESFALFENAEPVLVYFIFKWLKKYYHRDHDDSDLVRGRLKDVTNSYRALTRKAKSGETDSLVEWFEGNYRYDEMTGAEFIDLIVEKLEG